MVELQGRVLQAPKLQYGGRVRVVMSQGFACILLDKTLLKLLIEYTFSHVEARWFGALCVRLST